MQGGVNYNGSTLLTGGINVNTTGNIQALNVQITENGERTITPPEGVDGYAPITIDTNVPIPEPVLDTLNVTSNGTYTPPSGVDGYDEVNVNVPQPTPVLDDITITANGTYTPPSGVDGYDEITVNVSQDADIQPLTRTITTNGTTVINASDLNVDGFNPVTITTAVDGYTIKTLANTPLPIASFSDGTDNPLKSLTASIEPVQDLHGYDSPWAGGAGKNKLNYDAWKGTNVNNGTAVYENNGVTITATSNDAYTVYGGWSDEKKIFVSEGETVTLSWEESTNANGVIYIFPNGSTSGAVYKNNSGNKEVSYTVASGVTYITFRFGVTSSGTTIAYKNIMVRKSGNNTWQPYSNICPISGWAEEVIGVSGKNRIDLTYSESGGIDAQGEEVWGQNLWRATTYTKVEPSTNYTYSSLGCVMRIYYYDANKNFIRREQGSSNTEFVFTTPSNCCYVKWTIFSGDTTTVYTLQMVEALHLQIEKGDEATTYEPYAGTSYTIPFTDSQGNPVEVYGGEIDVINGVVTPCPYYASYNGEQLTGEWISDRDVYSPNTSPTIGAQVVNIGATGTPFSVQPTSIKSLDGENNVFASTGDVEELKYFADL